MVFLRQGWQVVRRGYVLLEHKCRFCSVVSVSLDSVNLLEMQ